MRPEIRSSIMLTWSQADQLDAACLKYYTHRSVVIRDAIDLFLAVLAGDDAKTQTIIAATKYSYGVKK